jgi:hypothetical protein
MQQNRFDILPVASGGDSYGAGYCSGLFGGFLPQPPTPAGDNEEALLLGSPPIGLVDMRIIERIRKRKEEAGRGLISPA